MAQNVELPHAHTATRHALDLHFLKLSPEKVSEYEYIKQCVRSSEKCAHSQQSNLDRPPMNDQIAQALWTGLLPVTHEVWPKCRILS